MSLTVSFNPTSISDEEREVLATLITKPGQPTARVFEGSAKEFLKARLNEGGDVAVTETQEFKASPSAEAAFNTPVGPSIASLVSSGVLPVADNPATGATSPAEAFSLATPETTPAAAFSTPVVTLPPPVVEAGIPASVNAPTATSSGVELDAEGLPYDARIHSSSREKIKNGTWKVKRGTGETFVVQVKNELRAALGAPAASPRVNTYPQPETPPVIIPAGEAWPFPTPNAAPVAPPVTPTGPTTLPEFMKQVGAGISSGKIAESDVHAACAKHGVQFHTLAARPDLIPTVWGELNG